MIGTFQRIFMLKKLQKKQISLIAGAALFAFSAGAMVSAPEIGKSLAQRLNLGRNKFEQISTANQAKSAVFPLVSQSRQQRAEKLEAMANGFNSPDRDFLRIL